jgi:capsular polysaccharide biosynthesis protein/glycosyltransferase involved in cell wall biosynthesis
MLNTLEFIDGIVARRENEGSLMLAKRMLIEKFGVQDGFGIYREKMTHLPDQGEIHLKPLASLQEVAQPRAGAYWQFAVREPFTVPVPRVIGDFNHGPLHGHSRSMFVACLGDARVRARSNIVEIDDLAVVDREAQELNLFDDRLDFDASVFQATDDTAWIITPQGNTASVELDEAFTLLGIRPHIFGHWMCEYLPKYIAASMVGALPPVPLLVEAGMPETHYEALRLLLAGPVEIVELPPFATARVRRLWCAPAQAIFPWWEVWNERFKWDYVAAPPARYAPIIREMARRADRRLSGPTGIDRVFLGRRGGTHEMVNAPAIQAAAEQRGFQVVFPEDLGFCQQARLLRHARFVVGPFGSAMCLAFFAKPATKLCILGNVEIPVCDDIGVYDAIGLDVTLLTGPCVRLNAEEPWRTDFEIDEATFCRFLDDWLQPWSTEARAKLAEELKEALAKNDHIRCMVAKRDLIERLGIVDGFAVYKTLIDRPDQAEIHQKRLASLQEIAPRQAAFYKLTAGREPVAVPVPRTIGEGNQYPLLTRSRSLFVACLGEARVRARSNLIEFGDLALADREGEEWSCYDEQYDYDASVFQASGEAAWIITPQGDSASLELDEAFTLLGARAHSFGHWMCEYLPKYIAASLAGALPAVPVLVEAGMPKAHYDALRLVLAEPVEIIELPPFATARVGRLWCAPNLALFAAAGLANERSRLDDNVLPPTRYGPIVREMARRAERELSEPTGIDRVFLARKAGLGHAMVNAAAIQAAAEQRGFRVIFPEDLAFREQARLVRHARFVAGPAGAAMWLGCFAEPGTKLCMLTVEWDAVFTQQQFTGVFEALGLDVTVITGPWVEPRAEDAQLADFTIDEAAFGRFLDQWLVPGDTAAIAARRVFDNQERLLAIKRQLVGELGVAEGFACYRQLHDSPEQAEIHQKRLASLQEIAPRQAAFYKLTAGREPVAVPVPRTIGEGNQYPLLTRSRSLFVACLGEARVRARSNLIEFGDLALADREGEEWSCYDEQYDYDASVFQASGEAAWIITPQGDSASLELDEAFTLLGARAHSFGHWMCEYLPKYIAASLAGALPAVPVLVEAGMPKAHYDALRLVLAEPVEIIELPPFATARVGRLWCAPNLALFAAAGLANERSRLDDNVLPPTRYGPIVREMARRAERELSEPTGIDRVFLARKAGLGHAMVNAAAIQAAAEQRGFRVIFPEDLAFREQARLVRHARFVAGPAGAAMWLGCFAEPGTKLCMLTVEWDAVFTQQQFTGVFEALGLDVTVITGPWVEPRAEDAQLADFTIDEAAFGRFLDQWLVPGDTAAIAARRVFDNQAGLLATKRWLVGEFGVAEGFALYRKLLDHQEHAEIRYKKLGWLQEVAQQRGAAYRPTAAAEPFAVPVPRTIGGGDYRPLHGRSRAMFVACLSDARVRARSNVIELDDLAVLDRTREEMTLFDDRLDFDASVFAVTDDAAWIIAPKADSASLELDEAFSLLGIRPQVFGHWMCEYLSRYVAASLSGLLPAVPVLVEAGMPKSHYEILELMLAGPVEIVELPPFATARVRRLWCAPAQAIFPWWEVLNERFRWDYVALSPARYAPIVQEMARRAERELSVPTGIDRVYLGSKGGTHEMVNAPAIQAAAEKRGFQVVFPEDLAFCEQARLLRHARFVVRPFGSAMYLAYFAKPGTKLCILANVESPVPVQCDETGVYEAIGLDVTLFTGPCVRPNPEEPWRTDFEIDEAAFCHFLDDWLQPTASPPNQHHTEEPRQLNSMAHFPLPLVSIVYLTYKQEKFALDALRSVLAQTYPMLDVIILDDASPDGTADIIAAELAKHRDRIDIRFIRNDKNLGVYGNERKGMSLSQGDFIVCFSGDDVMLPTLVERMIKVWLEHDVSLVTANALYIDEAGKELNRFHHNPAEPYDESFETLARHGYNAVCQGAAMGIERSLYDEFGWPPEYLTSADIMLPFYAYLSKGARFIPEPLLKYRVHGQNLSMSLRYERSKTPIDKLLVLAETRYIHIAHALLMISELERLAQADPARYGEVEQRLRPLLNALVHERAQQMVEARIELHEMGVTALLPSNQG